jgi:hypothetical protein
MAPDGNARPFFWIARRGGPPVERRMKPEDIDALLGDLAAFAWFGLGMVAMIVSWLP